MVGNSPRIQGIGRELRLAREAAGLEGRELAVKLGVAASTLSRWENSHRKPKPKEVARYLIAVQAPADLLAELVEEAGKPDGGRWLAVDMPEHRRQQAALLEIERNASTITTVSPLLIPGLLQTSEYARQIMISAEVPKTEVDTRVAVRIGRREVITQRLTTLEAFIGEAALRQRIGGPGVMLRELRYLLEESQRDNVRVAVIPLETGWHPGLEGLFTVFSSAERGAVVHVENRISGLFLHEQPEVHAYEVAAEKVREVAMSPEDSSELIAEVITAKETTS